VKITSATSSGVYAIGGGAGRQCGQLPDRSVDAGRFGNRVADQHGPGIDDPRDALKEISRCAIVDRDEDYAAQQAAPQRHDPLGAILSPHNDVLSLDHAFGVQPRGKGTRALDGVAVGQRPRAIAVVEDQELAADTGQILEEIDQRAPRHSAEL
jgi:hypothetical protein